MPLPPVSRGEGVSPTVLLELLLQVWGQDWGGQRRGCKWEGVGGNGVLLETLLYCWIYCCK